MRHVGGDGGDNHFWAGDDKMKNIEWQGYTIDNIRFGYVAGTEGGWYFTEHLDARDTLDSLEIDEIDGDGGLTHEDARSTLSAYLSGPS